MSLFSNESSSDGLGTYFKKWRAFQPCPAITQNKKGSANFVEICKKKHQQGYQLVLINFQRSMETILDTSTCIYNFFTNLKLSWQH